MLRAQIARRELPPGARLIPADIAAELGVSRGPVREAIAELIAQGLVEQSPRHAAYVRGLSAKDISQLSLLRGELEALAVRLACERLEETGGDNELALLERTLGEMRDAGEHNDLAGVTRFDKEFHEQLARMAEFPTLAQILTSLGTQIRPLIEASNQALDVTHVWRQHEPYLDGFRARDRQALETHARAHAQSAGQRIIDLEPPAAVPARAKAASSISGFRFRSRPDATGQA